MSDFKQLALEFVLTDDRDSHSRIAGDAAECMRNNRFTCTTADRLTVDSDQVLPGQQSSCCEMGRIHPAVDAGQRGLGDA